MLSSGVVNGLIVFYSACSEGCNRVHCVRYSKYINNKNGCPEQRLVDHRFRVVSIYLCYYGYYIFAKFHSLITDSVHKIIPTLTSQISSGRRI
jgi:hypothetical protein